MMKIKHYALALGLAFSALPSYAQYEKYEGNTDFTSEETRYNIAYQADSLHYKSQPFAR